MVAQPAPKYIKDCAVCGGSVYQYFWIDHPWDGTFGGPPTPGYIRSGERRCDECGILYGQMEEDE